MLPTALGLTLLAIAMLCQQTVVAMFNSCTNGDECIDIRQCDRFGPHHTAPRNWAPHLKEEFRKRVCDRNPAGVPTFKVCCPRPSHVWISAAVLQAKLGLLDLEQCGVYTDNRIAHGTSAQLFQFPWMVLLRSRGQWICGGTLINDRYVLTAAHCVWRDPIDYVRVGEYDLSRPIDCDKRGEVCAPAPQDIAIESSIPHEEYSARRKQNDIALLRLAQPAILNDNVMPICLPVTPDRRTTIKNPIYFAAGWGSTENALWSSVLQYAGLNLLPKEDCQRRLNEEDKYVKLYDSQMCAIGAKNLSDNCVGDSGGPLKSVSVTGQYVQYGVVSYGLHSCGKKSVPGVYTRIENYVVWILRTLEP